MKLHHIGIVVDNLAQSIPMFEVWMNAVRVGGIVEDDAQGARLQLLMVGQDTLLELVEPLPDSDIFLHRTGQYHLCFTVPDLDAEMRRLHDLGVPVAHPTTNAHHFEGRKLGFLATHGGQLLELLEETIDPVQ